MKLTTPTILLSLLLGCGSVVIEPALTGGTTSGTSSSGGGGSGAASTSSSSTGASSSGGAGGACTGTCPSCTPFVPWSRMVAAPDHDVVLGHGRFMAPDGSALLLADENLVKIDRDGQTVWKIDGARVEAVTPDDGCGMFVMGAVWQDTTSLFGQAVSCPVATCDYVARLDADGAGLWVRMMAPGQDFWPYYLAAGGGLLVAAGQFFGSVDFGAGPVVSLPDADYPNFLVAFSADDGHAVWTRKIDTPYYTDHAGGLAMSPAGDVVMTDLGGTSIDFGEGVVTSYWMFPTNAFVAAYDASGALRFGKLFGAPGTYTGPPLAAFDSAGDIVISEPVHGTIDFGGGLLGEPGKRHLMVLKLDAQGNHVFSKAFAVAKGLVSPIALDAANRIAVLDQDAATVLDAAGSVISKHPFSGSEHPGPWSIGFGPGGALVIAGTFTGTLDLGQGVLDAGAHQAVFAGALAP